MSVTVGPPVLPRFYAACVHGFMITNAMRVRHQERVPELWSVHDRLDLCRQVARVVHTRFENAEARANELAAQMNNDYENWLREQGVL